MKESYLHFTLGPVQGFVAQARRTRDFWAGSFLLSWLAGVAMAEIQRQGGRVDFPAPATGYLDWITGKGAGDPPRQGGIPNRFKALLATVPADFSGEALAHTVRAAWWALADHVWEQDNLDGVATAETRQIWVRQHRHFWEIAWALSTDPDASDLLDRRKNWRDHHPPPEPGAKCMMMDGWQELSGDIEPGRHGYAGARERFWLDLRESHATGIDTDLRDGESLCALAYVKRRFARHFETFQSTLEGGLELKGWALAPGVPSVAHMAAAHWLARVVNLASSAEILTLFDGGRKAGATCDEWNTRIACLESEMADRDKRRLLSLDAQLWFEHVRAAPVRYGYRLSGMRDFNHALAAFRKAHADFQEPSPFYAVLLMDGDSLGKHMADKANQQPISAALIAFTSAVPDIVTNNNGFLIYAGGDDVLALLPLEDALRCAAELRERYGNSFHNDVRKQLAPSISAAVLFTHLKRPLGRVLSEAHHLLDDTAKDKAGRDAVAVAVLKPGGEHLQWVQPWEIALGRNGRLQIEEIAEDFRAADGLADGLSSKFFFKIRERFKLLNPAEPSGQAVLDDKESCDLLAADYINSGDIRKTIDETMARKAIDPLLVQCRPVTRIAGQASTDWPRSKRLDADGALLVRFLAHKGVEKQ